MAKIAFKGSAVNTNGSLPAVGAEAPDFKGVKSDLSELSLKELKGKNVVINVFPSLDTAVCAASVRRFNKEAASLPNTVVLAVSKDLPFAHGRFCTTEGIDKVITLSAFRGPWFEDKYGMLMVDGPLKGLLARGVIVVDEAGKVVYEELVSEITNEPNYEAAVASLKN
ncbi:thiol peroxidase [uncultured Parabacteroides sp.]|jgi:thiol peroxidase|uniref:thiol peroxidase n=1 Tax=uncultured Parabacteroides sp. TaxID=512312 RepID=UPI0025ED2A37|nr:thiol peroxidase [uncultured Parabacteroides sp.]